MVSKHSAPHSIRFKHDLWARVVAHAEARGLTPNEAVVDLVDEGIDRWRPEPPSSPPDLAFHAEVDRKFAEMARAEIAKPKPAPVKVSIPLAGTFERKATPKGGKK